MSHRTALFCLTLVLARLALGADPVSLPPRESFHLYLLIGQSNMAGRGVIEAEDKTPHPRVLMLDRSGQWVPAVDPLHFDKPSAGTGLGKTFGRIMAEAQPGVTIGLIPCAVGGSPIAVWQPGAFYEPTKSHPWDDMMRRTQMAMKAGVLKGMLWHQGEADSRPDLATEYAANLQNLVGRLREALHGPEVPFVAGQMGRFDDVPWDEPKKLVDQAHRQLPSRVNHAAFVTAEGLRHKGDKIHFDSHSLRELGSRYAAAMRKLTEVRQP